MVIKFFKTNDPYGFLNNFKKSRMFIYGRWWNNVEAPYQFKKAHDPAQQSAIYAASTPREARDLGQKVSLRPDWYNIKLFVMHECVLAKFVQHHDLREQLMATGDEELVEDSPIDSFWGCGSDGNGQNMLGKILMLVRKELKDERNNS